MKNRNWKINKEIDMETKVWENEEENFRYQEANQAYWGNRAKGYSEVNRDELYTAQHRRWQEYLDSQIQKWYKEQRNAAADTKIDRAQIRILEVGTGPGFFAIILSELGYAVTAVDYTKEMLTEAAEIAREFGQRPQFLEMDAQRLDFPMDSFDVVLSRNLTWNLPKPELAYKEWLRVLKPNGQLLVFDANWYSYLYDDKKRQEYEADRRKTEELGIKDEYLCTDIDRMEAIAKAAPLSAKIRPQWDMDILCALGGKQVHADVDVWKNVWSMEEKINFSATPMFLVQCAAGK